MTTIDADIRVCSSLKDETIVKLMRLTVGKCALFSLAKGKNNKRDACIVVPKTADLVLRRGNYEVRTDARWIRIRRLA